MSKFRNTATGVVVSVDDAKDDRFVNGWVPAGKAPAPAEKSVETPAKAAPAKRAARKPTK